VTMPPNTFGKPIETKLNEVAGEGWELRSVNGPDLIFKRR
jgi:hypothetical protein